MKRECLIKEVSALEVFDSRGNPTIQVEVVLENGVSGMAIVPSGASTGSFEAVELRDGDMNSFNGKGVLKAVYNVNNLISKKVINKNVYDQEYIDKIMCGLDGTNNKSRLGANAILGVSLAVARAASKSLSIPLYEYIGGKLARKMPIPMMNILNGGKHSNNNLNIQEFMIMPTGDRSFYEYMKMCVEIYQSLKELLKQKGYVTAVGDEGGFAPDLSNDEEAIKLIIEAVNLAGYEMKKDINIALDFASTEMYDAAKKTNKEGYYFWKTNEFKSSNEMIKYIEELVNKYPIVSIEDGLDEEDWNSWKELNKRIGNKVQLVGDDLFVTNINRLKKGINEKSANSILIKLNQIGTLTETLNVIRKAMENDFRIVISHRSGETEDSFISDLAVATNVGQIKAGAPCRTDRISKYNRLLNIENQLKGIK